jgi:hypothetical protein
MYFGYGVITWEWREGVRSWVFPAFFGRRDASNGWRETGGYSRIEDRVFAALRQTNMKLMGLLN